MKIDVGIIGGTGIGDRLSDLGGSPLHVPTAAGMLRGTILDHEGVRILLLQRHSNGHKVPPHRVNYRAMALGLRQLGAKACFSSAAVGSLRAHWPAGTLVNCSDFLDFSYRNLTLFDRNVQHTDFGSPFDPICRFALAQAATTESLEIQPAGIYINNNGPRYETPYEIHVLKGLGDLVGMTAASEATLMREAGVPYGCLAVVTNLAAGISESALSHEEVVAEMERSGPRVVRILLEAAKRVAAGL